MNIITRELTKAEQAILDEVHAVEASFHALMKRISNGIDGGMSHELDIASEKMMEAKQWVHRHFAK